MFKKLTELPFKAAASESFRNMVFKSVSKSPKARDTLFASIQSAQASTSGAKGAGTLVKRQITDYLEQAADVRQKLTDAASIEEAVKAHADYVTSVMETNMNGVTDMAGLWADTFRETVAPIARQAQKIAKGKK